MAQVTLQGNPVQTNGSLPQVGSTLKDFVLTDTSLKDHSLKDYAGKKKLLSIVPSLDTAVCSLSAKKFNAQASKHPNCVVLVVSADLPFAQKRVCEAEGLKNVHTLSMMRSKDLAKDLGILITDGPLAGVAARAIVVIDEENKVLYTQLVPEITQEPNYEEALKALGN